MSEINERGGRASSGISTRPPSWQLEPTASTGEAGPWGAGAELGPGRVGSHWSLEWAL